MTDLTPIPPAQPLVAYFGGKRLLAKRIIARIEAIPHRCYAEPFVGMGGVFLRRARRPRSEIVNDINGEIVNLFRVIRECPEDLAAQFDWCISSRADFARMMGIPPETLKPIERAARFVYLQAMSFGGSGLFPRGGQGSISISTSDKSRFSTHKITRLIRPAHNRLQGVHIECLDWAEFIPRYDRPETLFYLDPPYPGHEADYGKGIFAPEDFARLAAMLRGLKGRFILSISDTPHIRDLFAWAEIEAVETDYSANGKSTNRRTGELLISGGG